MGRVKPKIRAARPKGKKTNEGYVRKGTSVPGVFLLGVPKLLKSRLHGIEAVPNLTEEGIEAVPNLTGVFGRVLRPYATLPNEAVPNLTEEGIEAVPTLTGVFGRVLGPYRTLPKRVLRPYRTLPKRVLRSYRTVTKASVGY